MTPRATIIPARTYEDPPSIADYEAARKSFDWQAVSDELAVDPAAMNLGELATRRIVEMGLGDEHALVWYGSEGVEERYSYEELEVQSARAASAFQSLGVERGDRVLFLLPNHPVLYFSVLGALRAGAVVGLLGGGRNMDYLRNILQRTKPKALVTVPAFRNSIASLREGLRELKCVAYAQRPNAQPAPAGEGEVLWSPLAAKSPAAFQKPPTTSADRAWVHYTDLGMSGSVCSHLGALGLFVTGHDVLELRPAEATMTVAMPGEPHFLPYAILAPFLAGARAVAIEDPARFSRYGDLAAGEQPRIWYSSMKAVDVILRQDPNLGTLLKGCRNIAVTVPYDRSFIYMTSESYGSPLHPCWWDREFGVIQTAELRGAEMRPGSIGRPVPGADVAIFDDAGSRVDVGMPGTLAVKLGPGCPFVEYLGDPGLTDTHVRDGWFRTTHSARLDAEGYVWLET